MINQLLTVDEVAGRLNMHVKTVRRYIREGKLKARRIGKEYRITRADLDAFAGATDPVEPAVVRTRQVTASTIVDVHAIDPTQSHRITTLLLAAMNTRRGEPDFPRIDSVYYPERAQLRIMITASPALTCDLLRTIDALLENGRG